MRKVIIMFALAMGIATANAQENVTVGTDNGKCRTADDRTADLDKGGLSAEGGGRRPVPRSDKKAGI